MAKRGTSKGGKKSSARRIKRDKYGRFAPKGRTKALIRAPKRDKRGRFVSKTKKRRRDQLDLLQRIVDDSTFDVSDYSYDEVKTSRSVRDIYEVEFADLIDIQPESVVEAFRPFREVLRPHYRKKSAILMARVGRGDESGERISEVWVMVTATTKFDAAFSQVEDSVASWLLMSSYHGFDAVGVRVEQ